MVFTKVIASVQNEHSGILVELMVAGVCKRVDFSNYKKSYPNSKSLEQERSRTM